LKKSFQRKEEVAAKPAQVREVILMFNVVNVVVLFLGVKLRR
jgi:hypothetical protein